MKRVSLKHGIIELTDTEIEKVKTEAKAAASEYAMMQYKFDRKNAYPEIGDQLDAIWKHLAAARDAGSELGAEAADILDEIIAVKNKYKKPDIS